MKRTETSYSPEGLRIARDYERCLSSMCHHVANDSYYGQPFLLEPFQRENIWKPIFASGEMVDGRFQRRFKRVLLGLPSGLGKTELAAALVLTIATMEVVHNGEYGVVASTIDQVQKIFDKIKTMIRLNDLWAQQWEATKGVIQHKETGAKIIVFPNKADALEGWHLNVLIFDELHVYRDDKTWASGLKGQKVLNNPLTIGITTAGESREGFLWELLQKVDKDPAMYTYWLGLDDKDNIEHKSAWKKMMVASWVTWESIQDQKNSASSQTSFERYTANRFPSTKGGYSCFKESQIKSCSRYKNEFDFSQPWTMGIDGATSGDAFAIIAYQQVEKNGKIIENTAEWVFDEPDPETGHYKLSEIEQLISYLANEHQPDVIAVDPNRLILLANHLEDTYGLETVAFPQNNATMCAASSLVTNSVKDKTLRLKGCPKLQRHLLNTVEDDKGAYGVRFGKNKNRDKIDAAIALALAELAYHKLLEGQTEYVPLND